MGPNPLQSCVATLPHPHIIGGLFPHTLPMDVHIDIVAFDHNPLDFEFEGDSMKDVEIGLSLTLKVFKLIQRKHHRLKTGAVFLLVGVPQ